jgi:hypothetical protein
MSRTISKYRHNTPCTIFNSANIPYDPFSETGRWRKNNLRRYQFRHNKGIPNSDCPIKTIARRGKFTAMHTVRVYYESTTSLFCMSSEDEINIGNDKEERN